VEEKSSGASRKKYNRAGVNVRVKIITAVWQKN